MQNNMRDGNGANGEFWAGQQARLDRTLAPVMEPLLAFAAPRSGATVMDVGCGCGATTVELARAVGPSGRVVGVDISEPMLALARERLVEFANAACRLGDAASLPLQDLRADLIFSRFGIMFFGDPITAFTNLRTGLIHGGRLRFACWRPISENPWLQIPLHAVYEHVPRIPKPDPEEPGPFSFADTERVTRILTAAGFTPPAFTPLNIQVDLAAGGTFEDAMMPASGNGAFPRDARSKINPMTFALSRSRLCGAPSPPREQNWPVESGWSQRTGYRNEVPNETFSHS